MGVAVDYRWYVVYTRANGESAALANLRRQGFEAWLPVCRKQRSHAGKVDVVLRPLFPRYLFVSFDPMIARWRSILSTVGVADLIRSGDQPVPVPDDVVASLREREVNGAIEIPPNPVLSPGEVVRVTGGPFADFYGRILMLSSSQRVAVLLDLLGRTVKVHFKPDSLART